MQITYINNYTVANTDRKKKKRQTGERKDKETSENEDKDVQ